ncbi:Cobyric acid synthase [Candidatus Hodgkinia cicadicola]|nr:Cobyric acid synthase [Candidatus Hodgkinia cicadicola]
MGTSIVVLATSSNAGKTFICSCLCKIARNIGLRVVPFKAQNMSNASFKSHEQIGCINVAQWIQSVASNQFSSSDFNPFWIKPIGERISQLYVEGDLVRCKFTYPSSRRLRVRMRVKIIDRINWLKNQNDLVVIEGAGSIVEGNLMAFDVGNIWLAKRTSSKISLIADMERGGALASIAGTSCLMGSSERHMINGFILNKFVGRISLLSSGLKSLEKITNWSCLGIIPWIVEALKLPWEDTLFDRYHRFDNKPVVFVVDILFGNGLDELNGLNLESNLNVLMLRSVPNWIPKELRIIILPDSGSVVTTVSRLHQTNWSDYLIRARTHGVLIIGVGVGFLAICSSFGWFKGSIWTDLKTFDANMLFLTTSSYSLRCNCELLSATFGAYGSLYAPWLHRIYGNQNKCEQLIECTGFCYGVRSSNVWSIAVNGVFMSDSFRSGLMRFIGVKPSELVYEDHVQAIMADAAIKVANCIGINLYRLFGL